MNQALYALEATPLGGRRSDALERAASSRAVMRKCAVEGWKEGGGGMGEGVSVALLFVLFETEQDERCTIKREGVSEYT